MEKVPQITAARVLVLQPIQKLLLQVVEVPTYLLTPSTYFLLGVPYSPSYGKGS